MTLHVAVVVEENADRQLAVATCAPRLLVVALDRLGQRVVDDEAHVGLVDAHAERDRRADNLAVALVDPAVLHAGALAIGQSGVVGLGEETGSLEFLCGLVALVAREAVDDTRLVVELAADDVHQFSDDLLAPLHADLVLEVLAVEALHEPAHTTHDDVTRDVNS